MHSPNADPGYNAHKTVKLKYFHFRKQDVDKKIAVVIAWAMSAGLISVPMLKPPRIWPTATKPQHGILNVARPLNKETM